MTKPGRTFGNTASKNHALLGFLLFTPLLAHAQMSDGPAVSGAGALSCGKFLEHQESRDLRAMHVSWVQGFLSGVNTGVGVSGTGTRPVVILPDAETIRLYVANYCKENPLDKPFDGALDLYVKLRSKAR